MEKLLLCLSITLLCWLAPAMAQTNVYFVFETQGEASLGGNQEIRKGDQIKEGDVIHTHKDSYLILVNKEGKLFALPKSQKISFDTIPQFSQKTDTDSFSIKFLRYVWEKFNKQKNNNHIGVVFRLDEIKLKQPSDSILVFSPEITFEWLGMDPSEKTYLFLREVGKSHYLKFGIRGNTVTLFVDNYILKSGKEYQWAISPKLFPDLESLKKHQFKILTENDYNILLQKYDKFIKSLMAVGIDGEDIKLMLLNNYSYFTGSD
ncbi:hypothetical protein O4H26_00725 [Aequorivita viscosa]|nr:hypothetical protein [Aequorivita viscosa]